MEPEHIQIRGAAEHNLKGIDIAIPKYQLVVLTGVSGSGKSSLAFDTLFAEGQRRYVESLSAYARQFLGQMDKPRYDSITGLSPTIAIEQKAASSNPRSTVGTVTEVYDYLRVLFARAGRQECFRCGRAVGSQTVDQIVASLLGHPEKTRLTILAPVARNRKGEFRQIFEDARRDGFVRVRVDGAIVELADAIVLDKKAKHDVDLVVDRIVVRDGIRPRLTDSVETALRHGQGLAVAVFAADNSEVLFSERNYCAHCDISYPELAPQLFSFNSPIGMCAGCQGLGSTKQVDLAKVVPNEALTLREGAVRPWANAFSSEAASWTGDIVEAACKQFAIDVDKPWESLSKRDKKILLYGSKKTIEVTWERAHSAGSWSKRFEGVANTLLRRWKETKSADMRAWYEDYLKSAPCSDCEGSRIRQEARHVSVFGRTLPTIVSLPIAEALAFFESTDPSGPLAVVTGELVREIASRLRFLDRVGLGYLNLSRTASTLSGGESQRIRLASQIGTELTGVVYILDEPSIGLHARDNARLIEALCRLRDIGNTVVVVEHDEEMMRRADHIIDFGPGAGARGGTVVAAGSYDDLTACDASVTGAFLAGRRSIAVPRVRRSPRGGVLIKGAAENNLRGFDVTFPLGVFIVVTGVSGAGKSTLVGDILKPVLLRRFTNSRVNPGRHKGVEGVEQLDKVVNIDQRPIGRTPRSNPATYTKVWDEIRSVFAQTSESKVFGYKRARFSFNVKGGRCERCSGAGVTKVEMHFLADVYVACDECHGLRFNTSTLRVKYRGKTIADVLGMSVDEATAFFVNHRKIVGILRTLQDVGLGYITLGQASTTLSGGEAQRVKLSRELARAATGRTMYLLDEPSTGLHFADVEKLLGVIQRLVDAGNTVVMVEHNLDVIKVADHVIDLGPDGGLAGGAIVAQGSPEEVAAVEESFTGRALAHMLPVGLDSTHAAGIRR